MTTESLRTVRLCCLAFAACYALSADSFAQNAEQPPRRERRTAPAQPPGEPYDLLFFGPQGAVPFRLYVVNGKVGPAEARREYARTVLRAIDADASGQLNAAEAANLPATGQLATGPDTLGEGWTALDANPQDGQLSEDEVFAFVDEKLGPRFLIKAKVRLQQSVRLTGPLDTNGDEHVDRDEINGGAATLNAFDFDADETLSVAELQPFPTAMRQAIQMQEANRTDQLPVASLLTAAERTAAAERLLAVYGVDADGGRGVPLEKLTTGKESIDADGDRRANLVELEAWLAKVEPAARFTVLIDRNYAGWTEKPAKLPQVEAVPGQSGDRRAHAKLGSMPVVVRAENNREGGVSDAETSVSGILVRFIEADADKNQYISEGEYGALQGGMQQFGFSPVAFNVIDRDDDKMLTRAELRSYGEVGAALFEATLVLTVSDDAKTLFEILDDNQDNRLSPREFLDGFARMRKFDHDRDGRLAHGELLSQYGIEVSPSRPEFLVVGALQAMGNNPGVPRIRPVTNGPTWFRKMDRNQDGDLTWREFLGTREDFTRIDANADGLIDLEESVAAK